MLQCTAVWRMLELFRQSAQAQLLLEALSCEQKKTSLRRVASSYSDKLFLRLVPLRRRVSKDVAGVTKAVLSIISCKGRMLFSCEETLKTLSHAI